MKKLIVNIMATTGIVLVALAIIGTFTGARFLIVSGVFQILAANTIINLGYLLTRKFESEYVALEFTIDIIYTIIVLIIFGAIFDWLSIWILVIMAIVIYFAGLFLSMFRIREEIKTINRLLQQRNNKSTNQIAKGI